MAERFTDARVPDPGVRALFGRQHRWQCWLDVEAALAVAEAECGVIPAAAAEAIASAARLAALDVSRIERGIAETVTRDAGRFDERICSTWPGSQMPGRVMRL